MMTCTNKENKKERKQKRKRKERNNEKKKKKGEKQANQKTTKTSEVYINIEVIKLLILSTKDRMVHYAFTEVSRSNKQHIS